MNATTFQVGNGITRWIATPIATRATHAETVSAAICHVTTRLTPKQYIARTEAWRPLDIHPDWLVWDGSIEQKKGK